MLARPIAITINADTKMSDLIDINCHLLLVINRFNIPLGFGDKTIKEICTTHDVDMDCFVSIAQFVLNPDIVDGKSFTHLNPSSVLMYLRNSHIYFLEQRLPDIRERLKDIFKDIENSYLLSILRFFDEYFNEVQEHMSYENDIVFPYIDKLLNGKIDVKFSIEDFTSHHSDIEQKITDLKHIIVKYMPPFGDPYKVTNILFDLFLSEEDLNTHCFIEEKVLVPLVRKIEKQLK